MPNTPSSSPPQMLRQNRQLQISKQSQEVPQPVQKEKKLEKDKSKAAMNSLSRMFISFEYYFHNGVIMLMWIIIIICY